MPLEDRTYFAPTKKCVWEGPPTLRTKHALQPLLSRNVGKGQMRHIETLFHEIAAIPSASIEDIVEELEYVRDNVTKCNNKEITELYRYLDRAQISTPKLRRVFLCLLLRYED